MRICQTLASTASGVFELGVVQHQFFIDPVPELVLLELLVVLKVKLKVGFRCWLHTLIVQRAQIWVTECFLHRDTLLGVEHQHFFQEVHRKRVGMGVELREGQFRLVWQALDVIAGLVTSDEL
uniref:Uncharacterized protein n=1 Tax=Pyramimonas obovata TaxID=1411642 RepID=A0A7S0N3L9_9CHLO